MHDSITIGIPVLAILLGILFNRSDVRRLEDKMEARFDKTEAEIRDLGSDMNARFNAVDARFNAVEARFNAVDIRFNAVDAELRYFHGATGKLEGRIQAIESR